MNKYIDADKLIALIDVKLKDLGTSGSVWVGRSVLEDLKNDIITSLQQEQLEIESHIGALSNHSLSSNLNDTAKKYAQIEGDEEYGRYNIEKYEGFKAGGEWMIGQMKQEQPEVDLEKELDQWRHKHFKGKRDGDYSGEYLERESQLDLARHFYEPGLNARKEE